MSAVITTPTTEQMQVHKATPSFFGLVRGEFFKLSRQWTTWILFVLLLGTFVLPIIVEATGADIKDRINADALHFYYNQLGITMSILRVFSGIFLLIVTARVIGLEYQLGTIRVLLSRGVGRLQLLFAKLLTVVLVALAIIALGILINYLLTILMVSAIIGNLDSLSKLTSQFWSDAWVYVWYTLLNAGVSILLATAAAVVGRSLSFGLSAALVFFPIDNFGTLIMNLAFRLTHSDFWLSIPAYFLGPNLNVMPTVLTSGRVDGTQTLVVAAVYAAIFAIAAIWLTWKRDVKE